jgi:hypothetical protein
MLSPRSRNTWHSWWSLTITLPFLAGLLFTVPAARHEAEAASRQQVAQGIITSHHPSDHNRCTYTFSVLQKLYSGADSAARPDVTIGENVLVYYDSLNPQVNSLDDFSKQAGQNEGAAALCLCLIGVFVGVVLYSKAQHKAVGL